MLHAAVQKVAVFNLLHETDHPGCVEHPQIQTERSQQSSVLSKPGGLLKYAPGFFAKGDVLSLRIRFE